MQGPELFWLTFRPLLADNNAILTHLLGWYLQCCLPASQPTAWHLWEWNCCVRSVSARQADDYSSMGIGLAAAQKRSDALSLALCPIRAQTFHPPPTHLNCMCVHDRITDPLCLPLSFHVTVGFEKKKREMPFSLSIFIFSIFFIPFWLLLLQVLCLCRTFFLNIHAFSWLEWAFSAHPECQGLHSHFILIRGTFAVSYILFLQWQAWFM